MAMVFVGHDWAEAHHDVYVADDQGKRLARGRLPEGVEGVARFHEPVAPFIEEPADVVMATEADRGLFIGATVAAGYTVVAVNPMSTSRYRERHSTSGAKSDPGDARVLAEVARTDRQNHRPIAGDSDLAEVVKVLARAHQGMIWSRQRQLNQLRSTLREFYPRHSLRRAGFGRRAHHLGHRPHAGPRPATLAVQNRCGTSPGGPAASRRRTSDRNSTGPTQPPTRSPDRHRRRHGHVDQGPGRSDCRVTTQIGHLETELVERFEQHPDAKIIRSLPGLGMILGARVLGEFGDDPNRYAEAKSRKNYAGTSPITKASGTRKVVLARYARNRRLADACNLWAFAALTASPGARAFYDQHRAAGDTDHRALRALANRLVGILHGCLRDSTPYDEHTAWGHRHQLAA